ncbi:MAG: formate dehydrogenase accessory sulfurtransferase FdhD [Verrucomicrobia bacterium]|nr:MAG: formate dehydrogenase accessory sulfurtransferase FdhD [Verrucomicrobiota bacterium]
MRASRSKRLTREIKPALPEPTASGAVPADVVHCCLGAKPRRQADALAREEPLEIRVRGRSVAVIMRTPGEDRELAAGFLLTEGIIKKPGDIVEIAPCLEGEAPENTLNVFLAPAVAVDFDQLTRHVFASSSCGLCGKASIEAVHQHFPPIESNLTVSARTLSGLPPRMRAAQVTFASTGGLHAAALFDARGKLIALREDVGRHNAVDKVLGYGLLEGLLPFDVHLLLVSGRASFEIMQKALAARVPLVAAVSAPSSLAVDFARESGQTLVGFLRGRAMNVYCGAERITGRKTENLHLTVPRPSS